MMRSGLRSLRNNSKVQPSSLIQASGPGASLTREVLLTSAAVQCSDVQALEFEKRGKEGHLPQAARLRIYVGRTARENKHIMAATQSNLVTARAFTKTCCREYPDGVMATIKGRVPAWLDGSLLRTGPARYEFGEQKYNHMFDGQAQLHRFTFDNGAVHYRSRYLDSQAYAEAMKEKRIIYTEFGTAGFADPCLNIFSRTMSTFLARMKFTDNCNVNFMRSGDEFYTITETPRIVKVDPVTLHKQESFDMSKIISVLTGTAHPHQDPDGTIYNLGLNFKIRSTYNIVKIPPIEGDASAEGPALKQASIALTLPATDYSPTYSHSFFLTPNYFILVEQPLYINMVKLASLPFLSYSFCDVLEFFPDRPTRFHVVRRADSAPVATKYVTGSLFFFHQINAHERDGHLVLDMCAYKDDSLIKKLYLKELAENGLQDIKCKITRFILPLNIEGFSPGDDVVTLPGLEGSALLESADQVFCKPIVLSDLDVELPRIHYERFNGKQYRYVYGTCATGTEMKEIGKIDVEDGSYKIWSEEDCLPSEPVFVGNPEGAAEDDGVVLSSVLNLKEGGAPFLLILDAKTFSEVGRAELPIADMAFGLHGIYAPHV